MATKTKKKAVKKAVKPPKPVAKKKAPEPKPRIPRQRRIPGMEDTKISAIENIALDYVELRDERLALLKNEVELKKKLIDSMHKAQKTEYKRNGITVKLTTEKEGVKVRVKEENDIEVKTKSTEPEPEEPEQEEPEQGEEQQPDPEGEKASV